jgi:hypothetical protein
MWLDNKTLDFVTAALERNAKDRRRIEGELQANVETHRELVVKRAELRDGVKVGSIVQVDGREKCKVESIHLVSFGTGYQLNGVMDKPDGTWTDYEVPIRNDWKLLTP